MWTWLKWLGGGVVVTGLAALALRAYTLWRYDAEIHAVEQIAPARVAIVFGAGLLWDGRPTAVLYDRVATAADLYHQGKVQKLLLSGDNRFDNYNEPAAMRRTAVELGVPESAVVLDYAGQRTYDTCYRARAIFGVTEAVLVTQRFHLPRALLICEELGVRATGVAADRRQYRLSALAVWNGREVLATLAAWWDVRVARPTPILGERLPIP